MRHICRIQPPHSTRSPSTLTLLRPSVTLSLKFADRSIAIAVPSLWNQLILALWQMIISDKSYKLSQTSSLAISPQSFHSKLKMLLFSISHPESSSFPCLPPHLSSNTIHHLTVYLPDSLDFDPLPIDFVMVKRLWISWFPQLCSCGLCRNLEIMTTISWTAKCEFQRLKLFFNR